jgi:hypothetical protein
MPAQELVPERTRAKAPVALRLRVGSARTAEARGCPPCPQVCATYDVAHYDPEVIAKREAEFLRLCGQLTGASTIAWQVRICSD